MVQTIFSKYSRERAPKFSICTSIMTDGKKKWVEKRPLTDEAKSHIENIGVSYRELGRIYERSKLYPCPVIIKNGIAKFEFIVGKSFQDQLNELVAKDDKKGVVKLCQRFVSLVKDGKKEDIFSETPDFVRIFGEVDLPKGLSAKQYSNVDLIFENLLEDTSGNIAILDYEWCFPFQVPLEYIIWRSLLISFEKVGWTEYVNDFLCPLLEIPTAWIPLFWKMEGQFSQYNGYKTIGELGSIQTIQTIQEECKQLQCHTQVYFDRGNGLNESDSTHFYHSYNNNYILNISTKDIRNCRIDPSDTYSIVTIKKCCAVGKDGIFDLPYETNGIPIGEAILFDTVDPQIWMTDLPEKVEEIRVVLNVVRITPDMAENYRRQLYIKMQTDEEVKNRIAALEGERNQLTEAEAILKQEKVELGDKLSALEEKVRRDAEVFEEKAKRDAEAFEEKILSLEEEKARFKAEIAKLGISEEKSFQRIEALEENLKDSTQQAEKVTQELAQYREHYHLAIAQREELRMQLAQAQNAYNVISNAFFWKITKPARVMVDALKSLIKKNHYTWLFFRGLKCFKQNGFRYTWNKVRNYHKHNTQYHVCTESVTENQKEEKNIIDGPKFSILVPLYNTPTKFLREMIESVLKQSYPHWELCLADGSVENSVEKICNEYLQQDSRIHYRRLEKNLGISGNSNACAEMADGEFFALLDHDDILAANALEENVKAILATQADVFYSDEDHITQTGTHVNPFFKPDWSPDLLHCQMYICHLLIFRRDLFLEIGGFQSRFDGCQDYDLMLRLSECTNRICHIPEILYSWRECETSTAANADAKPYVHQAQTRALDEHLKRQYGPHAYAEECGKTVNARFELTAQLLVSIIIPMKDKAEMTADCIDSILTKSSYQNFEILLLDNRSEEEKTKQWLKSIPLKDKRIRVIAADMEFNWSKLNNFGVSHAKGDIFIFLNNDTLVISEDWMERLSENAWRDDIGVVGPLLLYPDETIQHAGVIVAMSEWADHIYKGMPLRSYNTPFVSPTVSRNVLAVTGACMAVSRKTWEYVGTFDEGFIICGSDVEYGIRAYEKGLFNRYDANVQLYHLESKSRDQYIPEIDYKKSYIAYTPYRENVDPFFNINLERNSVIPKEHIASMDLINFKNFLKRCPITAKTYQKVKSALMSPYTYVIPEVTELKARKSHIQSDALRINLLVPTVNKDYVFGGISTAIKFFDEFQKQRNWCARIIVTDSLIDEENAIIPDGYTIVRDNRDDETPLQILSVADRIGKTIPVRESDVFVATAWWDAYIISDVIHWQSETYHIELWPLVYFIQDYEPGFYPWSSRYLMADSTYHLDIPTFAVINTSILKDYFDRNGYSFAKVWSFEPRLNDKLKCFLPKNMEAISKKKQILVYGRPSVARNAFEIIVYALKEWSMKQPDIKDWTILSAGESHADVDLGNGAVLHSLGKLSLDEYAQVLLQTYAGISLMVSPHPSYPPLEMASFGIKTITNIYENKDLEVFNPNIISLLLCNPNSIASELLKICTNYIEKSNLNLTSEYMSEDTYLDTIACDIANLFADYE